MIYTVTFNPSIDYVVHIDKLERGQTNRTKYEEIYFGGKGINVSLILHELEMPSVALGFIGGFTGAAIENELKTKGIDVDFVPLETGFSRINIKIKSTQETELNAQGPNIDEKALLELYKKLDKLKDGDTLVLAGSIPNTMPSNIYEKILAYLQNIQLKVVVDATGDLLKNILKFKPFLVKPNQQELGELFNTTINTHEEIIIYANKLKELGAINVIVSMAEEGSILVDEFGKVHTCKACSGTVKNSVGAGDSMVAGFIVGSMEKDYTHALKLATASGGATAFSSGLGTKKEILELLSTI
ncbi:MAG: 1-phosphofructokinase, partial [Anaerotignaceae bacterium]